MKKKALRNAVILGLPLLAAGWFGLPTAHGYLHAADPFVLLAGIYLPLPHALITAVLTGMLSDLLKGYYALSLITGAIRIAMIFAIRALLKTRFARAHREIAVLPAALVPVMGYYIAELLAQLIGGAGAAAFVLAAGTLRKDLLQAAGSMLVFVFLYDMIEGFRKAKAAPPKTNDDSKEDAP